MIFVTVGTNEAPFDRLLEAFATLDLEEEAVVQHGHSRPIAPPAGELVDFLAFDRMNELMRRARVVVTHAGVGSVLVALANGRRPIVVPRRKAHGEAVDDHQFQLARRFAREGLVIVANDPDELAAAIAASNGTAVTQGDAHRLAGDIRAYIKGTLERNRL